MVRLISLFILLSLSAAQAQTIRTAASANVADIQTQINNSVNGDTINVPAGTVTWTQTLNFQSKAISVIGAGPASTIVNNSVGRCVLITNTGANFVRLSGFRFNNADNVSEIVSIRGPATSFRVDNCYFNKGDCAVGANTGFVSPYGTGPTYGVIDHCTFVNMKRPAFCMDYRSGQTQPLSGSASWISAPPIPGSGEMVFWEDNTFTWDANLTDVNAQCSLYGQEGGKVCFRNNTNNGWSIYVDAHGDNPGYSTHYYEIYNNIFNEGSQLGIVQGEVMFLRGGIHVIHDNTFNVTSTGNNSKPVSLTWYWLADVRVIGYQDRDTFFWNNTWNRTAAAGGTTTNQSLMVQVKDSGSSTGQPPPGYAAAHIRVGQEYWLTAPASGQWLFPYTTYTYPHPLVTGTPTPPDTTAPTLTSATINTSGTTLTLVFSEAVNLTTSGGLAVNLTGGAITPSNLSGTGSAVWVFNTLSRVVNAGQTGTIVYTQSGNGIEDLAGNDLATVTKPIVNNSTQGPPVVPPLMPGLTFEAEAGFIEAPFVASTGTVSQSVDTTDPAQGGRARWRVTIPATGIYTVNMNVNAPDGGADSIFVDFDQEPTSPLAIFDIITTTGTQTRTVTWRGTVAPAPQFSPKQWTLTAGEHTLYLRGREAGVQVDTISIIAPVATDTSPPVPNPPTWLQVPIKTGASSIAMTANSVSDSSVPVAYFFDETSGNPGGSDSGWQASATYEDIGLTPGIQYTYRVQAMDAAVPANETSFSTSLSATTSQIPGVYPATPGNKTRSNIVNP